MLSIDFILAFIIACRYFVLLPSNFQRFFLE